MFSGIVEEFGSVKEIKKKKNLYTLKIKAKKVVKGTKVGDSICVDGVCLTVTNKKGQTLTFDVMKESLDKTVIQHYKTGTKVNLERSLKVDDRLGGHFVSGHVDCVGVIKKIVTIPNYVEFQISVPKEFRKYIAPKGSVCLDGISLTIGDVRKTDFSIYLIPFTLDVTTFGDKKEKDELNIETDLLAKYLLNAKETM